MNLRVDLPLKFFCKYIHTIYNITPTCCCVMCKVYLLLFTTWDLGNILSLNNIKIWCQVPDAFNWCSFPMQVCCLVLTMCRNYLFIVELEKSVHKNWMGRLPYFHVRMNYFWWAKTERLVIYSAVNLLFRNNKIQLSTCHHLSIYMHCKISFTYLKHFAL